MKLQTRMLHSASQKWLLTFRNTKKIPYLLQYVFAPESDCFQPEKGHLFISHSVEGPKSDTDSVPPPEGFSLLTFLENGDFTAVFPVIPPI